MQNDPPIPDPGPAVLYSISHAALRHFDAKQAAATTLQLEICLRLAVTPRNYLRFMSWHALIKPNISPMYVTKGGCSGMCQTRNALRWMVAYLSCLRVVCSAFPTRALGHIVTIRCR